MLSTSWLSVIPPLPAENPTRTCEGSDTVVDRYDLPSMLTASVVPDVSVTTMWCAPLLRRVGIFVLVEIHLSPPDVLAPLLIPTKFDEGLPPPLNVSKPTQVPGMGANPRLPPVPPSDVGFAPDAGFAKTIAIPSAPDPPPIVLSNVA